MRQWNNGRVSDNLGPGFDPGDPEQHPMRVTPNEEFFGAGGSGGDGDREPEKRQGLFDRLAEQSRQWHDDAPTTETPVVNVPALPVAGGETGLAETHPLIDGRTTHSLMARALAGERPETTPVWFMRQAGRSLPEYRALRERGTMLEACLNPETAAEITLQPVRRHGVDAAVFFSDIVVPLKLAGVEVEIEPGRGPVFAHPVRTLDDVANLAEKLRRIDKETFSPVSEAVQRTVAELGSTPLIGFAGAPFTLAAYLVEGGPSKDHLAARSLMYSDPIAWQALMQSVADLTGAFLRAQVVAGASVAQLFDSWAGSLSRADYKQFVLPASVRALDVVRDLGVPLIHFGVGTGHMLEAMRDAGVDGVGIDWRTPLNEAADILGPDVTLQGNLDPAVLGSDPAIVDNAVADVLERGLAARAHIFNLGHGVPATTDPDVLTRIVERVHAS